ncbi:MAG: hypothetical protein MZV63_27550 [Marinilabiliales bacterium]|nr:hypothetical protein [Marinilabiliales bacterium]
MHRLSLTPVPGVPVSPVPADEVPARLPGLPESWVRLPASFSLCRIGHGSLRCLSGRIICNDYIRPQTCGC